MKLVKKIFKNKVYKDTKGKEHYSTLYVFKLENGQEVAIKPVYGVDYPRLDLLVHEVKVIG